MTLDGSRKRDQISLVLIEDNRLLRSGIVALIGEQPDIAVLAAPTSVGKALTVVRDARPQVVVLDCALAGYDSLQLTATVHAQVPETRIVGLGLFPRPADVAELVRMGASGFVMKNAPVGDLLAAIRSVALGVTVVPPQLSLGALAQAVLEPAGDARPRLLEAVRLTSCELAVVNLAGDGRSRREIAAQLGMPIHRVASHMRNLMEKLVLRTQLDDEAFAPN